jgi:hypothetical protein
MQWGRGRGYECTLIWQSAHAREAVYNTNAVISLPRHSSFGNRRGMAWGAGTCVSYGLRQSEPHEQMPYLWTIISVLFPSQRSVIISVVRHNLFSSASLL